MVTSSHVLFCMLFTSRTAAVLQLTHKPHFTYAKALFDGFSSSL